MNAPDPDNQEPVSAAEAMAAIAAEPHGPRRERLTNAFLKDNSSLIAAVARRQCRAWRLRATEHFDDIQAITMETAWQILDSLTPKSAKDVRSWPAYLTMRTRTAVRIHTESSAWTGVSGAVGAVRRNRSIHAWLRERREALGRDMTKQEVREAIDEYNEQVLGNRADAEKQGALVSENDLVAPGTISYDGGHAPEPTFTMDEAEVAQFQMAAVVNAVVAGAFDLSDDLGIIAREYFSPYLSRRDPDPPRMSEIAATTGFNRMKVSRALMRIHVLCRDELEKIGVVTDVFGQPAPTSPDPALTDTSRPTS